MKNIFDYTYFRTAKKHFKRDGIEAFTAILTISFIIFLYCIPLYSFLLDILSFKRTHPYDKFLLIFIGLLIFFSTKKRYKGKYFTYRDKWINETKREKILGELLIVFFFFSPLLIMLIIQQFCTF
ncbi:hypothetical protein [Flavobacterium flavipallidum]|uniref:Uncharacterized protein n=1 Tax=Flavobacterium flavipallidum TaxID=3139140 RepID=A0ABU9HM87_9FLAO